MCFQSHLLFTLSPSRLNDFHPTANNAELRARASTVFYAVSVSLFSPLLLLPSGTPRPGTCPSQLLPPPGPCVSDSDACMLDVDCDGSTKKCCYNNCFKVCVEPGESGLSAIRGNFASLYLCYFKLRSVLLFWSETRDTTSMRSPPFPFDLSVTVYLRANIILNRVIDICHSPTRFKCQVMLNSSLQDWTENAVSIWMLRSNWSHHVSMTTFQLQTICNRQILVARQFYQNGNITTKISPRPLFFSQPKLQSLITSSPETPFFPVPLKLSIEWIYADHVRANVCKQANKEFKKNGK